MLHPIFHDSNGTPRNVLSFFRLRRCRECGGWHWFTLAELRNHTLCRAGDGICKACGEYLAIVPLSRNAPDPRSGRGVPRGRNLRGL